MKKIIFIILLFLIVIFVGNFEIHEKVKNEPENRTIQNETKGSENIAEINPAQEKSLDGKTIAFIGDSLIEGYGNDFHGFDYYLAKDLPNTNFINNSKSGSTITDNSGSDHIIMLNQAKTLQGNPDIIVFDGGANDIMGYSLGFLDQDLKKEIGKVGENGETVISDFEEVIAELKTRFPNAKLCYFQPFLLDDETILHLTQDENAQNEIKARRDIFYQEVQKMCSKWKIAYWDVASNFEGTGTTYRQEDWIHIKVEGYELLTPILLEKLDKLKE